VNDWVQACWAFVALVAVALGGTMIIAAINGNTALARQQIEIDGKNYATCVQYHSTAECRVGEYGVR
jgi:hypothetical protein